MDGLEIFKIHYWKPLSYFGFDHPLFWIHKHTIIFTWAALAILLIACIYARLTLHKKKSIGNWLVSTSVQSIMEMTEQSIGFFSFNHCAFVATLFMFILLCNLLGVFPWLAEPTSDLNTTLALGLTSFLYTQWNAIKAHGFWGYFKEYFAPFFLMLPINIIGKFASVISISFRLFGNIFGGAMIMSIYQSFIQKSILYEIIGIAPNIVLVLFFGVCESFLQAFVFSMLALAYLGIGIQGEMPEDID